MANTTSANVYVIDTTGAISGNMQICGIKYIAGSGTPSVQIRSNASGSGTIIYEEDGTADKFEQVHIRDAKGVHVTVAGTGTKVYLYLK